VGVTTLKRFLCIGALAFGVAVVGAGAAQASTPNPGPTCGSDQVAVPTPLGVACANGDPGTQSGHVYADGESTNPGAGAGYIGVNSTQGVVGCSQGNYDRSEGADPNATPNHVLLDPSNPSVAPPDPSDPCTPSGP